MKIKATQKIYDGLRSYEPGVVIEWPSNRALPVDAGVTPAGPEDVTEVRNALRKQLEGRIAHNEAFLKRSGLTSTQTETAMLALQRYKEQLARVEQIGIRIEPDPAAAIAAPVDFSGLSPEQIREALERSPAGQKVLSDLNPVDPKTGMTAEPGPEPTGRAKTKGASDPLA